MDGTMRARMVAQRFERELGYGKATVYPIHNQRRSGRVMGGSVRELASARTNAVRQLYAHELRQQGLGPDLARL